MNKYLEKIASFTEIEPGLHYDRYNGQYHITDSTKKRINDQLDYKNRMLGTKLMAGVGAAFVGAANIGSAFNIKKFSKSVGVGALVGAAMGHGLGALGNKQIREFDGGSRRLSSEVSKRARDYKRTTEYQLYNNKR